MKRTLALLLLVSLVSTPALAYAQAPEKDKAEVDGKTLAIDNDALTAATIKVAHDIVVAESKTLEAAAAPQVPGRAGPGWRTATGIAMLVGGAAIIWKGADVYDSEPDRFGRVKNADAYLAYGVGATIVGFGAITLMGGLQGRGF